MAAPISAPPVIDSITLDSTFGETTAITLHRRTRRIRCYSSAVIKIARSGTEGTAIGDDYIEYAAGVAFDVPISGAGTPDAGDEVVLYIASDTSEAVLKIEASEVA